MRRVTITSGRSTEHVWRMCHLGLLPGRLLPDFGTQSAQLPEDVALLLVDAFESKAVSPSLARLMKADPERVLALSETLASLARLSMTEQNHDAHEGEAA